MPLRFWKKEKPEKGKEEDEAEEAPKEAPKEASKEGPIEKAAPPPEAKPKPEPEAAKAEPPAPPKPGDIEAAINEVHAGLVDLGLTVPATKAVFAKRVAAFPGGDSAFFTEYRATPYRAVTRVLVDWLGIRVPEQFEPEKLLEAVNLRLSSFKLSARAKDVSWLDQELNLRKAKLTLADQERVVRFKDARDFLSGLNDMLGGKKLAFVELETWTDDLAFLLVREPRWDRLAATDLVVVKADETARGGECGECGAPVGKYWSDCLKCGAVFS